MIKTLSTAIARLGKFVVAKTSTFRQVLLGMLKRKPKPD